MDVFGIIGPIMIGPSSSHTAGAVRIGKVARILMGTEPVKADIGLFGSFAKTYKGHGTDKAIMAGIMGMNPDDDRIRNSLELAEEKKIEYRFKEVFIENAHPNTTVIELTDKSNKKTILQGASVGGGNIQITEINGMAVDFSGQYDTLIVLHQDVPGIIAEVTGFLAERNINIFSFKLSRKERGGTAVMTIEADETIPDTVKKEIVKEDHIISCIIINK